ncbi:MAG: RDD family protein [Bacteroidia bacterium]|nr:RDD family protein [Bacteroidia bacterium]
MSTVRIPTNFNIDLDFEVPEFYRRMLAWLLDIALLFFYIKIANEVFKVIIGNRHIFDSDESYNIQFMNIILWLPVFIYHPICEITMNGQSFGKKLTGLQVVNETGGRPAISQFLIRWLIRTADIMIIVLILYNVLVLMDSRLLWALIGSILLVITDVVLVVSTEKSQRLGDILAKTILIRTQAKGSIEETVFQEVADNYVPVYPQIMQLSDRDINAIKSILETAMKKNDINMAASAGQKIKAHLKINSSLSPFEFLAVLLKDYNYLSVK